MKILMFMWRDIKNPTSGGAGRTTHELCKRWVHHGHQVTIFTSAFPGCDPSEVVEGYQVIRKGSLLTHFYHAWRYYRRFLQANYDLVIDQINTIPYFTPLFVRDAQVVTFIHQLCREIWFYEAPLPVALVGYLLEPLYLRLYRKYPTITVSESTRQDLRDMGFSNVSIVYNAIDQDLPVQKLKKEKDPTIIFVGRLKKAKRPHHLLRAVSRIKDHFPGLKVWIVGEGDFKKILLRLVQKYDLQEHVTFFGWIPRSEKMALMQRAHCICVPSVREGWGLIVTEANSVGTPAIAYNVPGLRDSVREGTNGLLTGENTPQGLADAFTRFFSDEKLRAQLILSAPQEAKRFAWEKSAAAGLRILEMALNKA